MPIVQKFEETKRAVFVLWEGVVTAEEWFSYLPRLLKHNAWNATSSLLADLLWVRDTSSIGDQEMAHAVEILLTSRTALRGKKMAVLAQDQFGKAKRFGELLAPFGVFFVVFNDLDTACSFLDIDTILAYRNLDEMRQNIKLDL